jgi:predicted Rossmann-fold nucleotide-binding protein
MSSCIPIALDVSWSARCLVGLRGGAGTVVEALLAWWLLNAAGWRPLLLVSVAPLGEGQLWQTTSICLPISR